MCEERPAPDHLSREDAGGGGADRHQGGGGDQLEVHCRGAGALHLSPGEHQQSVALHLLLLQVL